MRWVAAALLALAEPALAQAPPPAPGQVLTLDEAVRLARQNQPQLRQARAGAEAAAARADQARSPLLPQVFAGASYSRSTRNGRPGLSPAGEGLDLSGTVSQLLWDFGQTPNRYRAARAGAEAQREAEQATGLQVVLGVRTAYFAARAAKDLVAVARDNLSNQEAHLRQIQGFVEVGTRPEIDLAQARTDRANAQVQLINSENGYAVARAQLNLAMGVEGPTGYDVADETLPPVEGEDGTTDALLAEALRARPDVASLASQLRAQQATLWAVQGGYLPSLGVSSGLTDAGTPGSTYWNWNASLTLSWDVFSGGLTRAQEQEARANLDGLDAQGILLRQQVRLEVEQARLAVRAAGAALSAAGEALENARERLRLAEGRYQTGAGSVIEQGDAQVAVTSAAAQRVQAQYALSSARAQLLSALGRP
ncbi:MAG TPA: TolC family protein [Anaeromyxobacteraceae bacterium]|nr:TolC family protein [Anaeromyxobacteraceae bacterium]